MKKLLTFNLSFLLFTFYFLLSTSKVRAQSLSLSLWPPLLEVTLQPGKSLTQVYKIANPSENDVVLTSSIASFRPADEKGNVSLGESESNDWFSFQNADLALGQDFVLKAGKEQEVVLKIKAPENTAESDHYYSLVFETTTAPVVFGDNRSQTQMKIAANILLTVSRSGTPSRSAKIKQFSLANFQFSIFNFQLVDSFDRPEFILRLQNTGQAFFKPEGTITVNGWFNQKYTLDLLPENVLTNSVRRVSCQKDSNPMLCVVGSKFLLGRYTARVEFGLAENDNRYQKEMVFWAIPAKLLIGVLTIIFLLITIKSRTELPIDKRFIS